MKRPADTPVVLTADGTPGKHGLPNLLAYTIPNWVDSGQASVRNAWKLRGQGLARDCPWLKLVIHSLSPGTPDPDWSVALMGIKHGRYCYTSYLRSLDSCLPTSRPPSWPCYPTPVQLSNLVPFISCHPDQTFAQHIQQGLSNGFHVGFRQSLLRLRASGRNHPPSLVNPGVVWSRIQTEVAAERMVGPLSSEWATLVHCSPLGLVPKGVSGKWRVIVDLSFPWGRRVNAAIDQDLCFLRYASLDNAIDLVRKLGRGTQMVKMDLKDAYRMVPVHPHDQHLLGISWQGSIYVDRCLPFGLRSAPKIFTAVVDALAWALFCRGITHVGSSCTIWTTICSSAHQAPKRHPGQLQWQLTHSSTWGFQ